MRRLLNAIRDAVVLASITTVAAITVAVATLVAVPLFIVMAARRDAYASG